MDKNDIDEKITKEFMYAIYAATGGCIRMSINNMQYDCKKNEHVGGLLTTTSFVGEEECIRMIRLNLYALTIIILLSINGNTICIIDEHDMDKIEDFVVASYRIVKMENEDIKKMKYTNENEMNWIDDMIVTVERIGTRLHLKIQGGLITKARKEIPDISTSTSIIKVIKGLFMEIVIRFFIVYFKIMKKIKTVWRMIEKI